MSYEKAMKHSRNVRKCRKQARQYMGFDAGTGRWPSVRSNPYMVALLNVREWFRTRHVGNFAYNRECVIEAIADCRKYGPVKSKVTPDANGQLPLFPAPSELA